MRLGTFVIERFPPLAYGLLVAAFVACGTAAAAVGTGARPSLGPWIAAIWLVITSAFLQLRILDEIKDAPIDAVGRSERPVPRGLVTVPELRRFAIAVWLAGSALALALGPAVAVSYAVATGTIWLLRTLRAAGPVGAHPRLREALTHSVISPLLLVCAWTSVAALHPLPALASALTLAWGASLAMEVARKTVRTDEERAGVPTYSAELGRSNAMLLGSGALAVALFGATGIGASVGAAPVLTIAPLLAAVAVPLLGLGLGQRVGTLAVQGVASSLVLAVLVWPLVVLLSLG